jgi:signal-transduction protein with cAMP-binding, CBS, and nucleotidyltransferase domain
MLVEQLLPEARKRLVTISDDSPLIEAAKLLRAGTDLIVVSDPAGLLVGVITKSDVVSQISHCEGASCLSRASTVMTRSVATCSRCDWVKDVWLTMKQRELKNIPIIDAESRPLGLLNARDVLQALLKNVEYEESLLIDYVAGIGYR